MAFHCHFTYCFPLTVYLYANEHNGVRQTLNAGVAFARGAAEVCSFSFSILLITMCYNMVRYMRETVLNLYIPFDKNIVFHKIVAWTAVAFTGMGITIHCGGGGGCGGGYKNY